MSTSHAPAGLQTHVELLTGAVQQYCIAAQALCMLGVGLDGELVVLLRFVVVLLHTLQEVCEFDDHSRVCWVCIHSNFVVSARSSRR